MRIRLWLLAAMAALFVLPAAASARKGFVPFVFTGDDTGSVGVFETTSDQEIATVLPQYSMLSGIHGVAVAPNGSVGFASFTGSDVVAVVEPSNAYLAGPVGTVAVGPDPTALAVTPDNSRVYVTNNGSNTVSAIDIASFSVVGTISLGSGSAGQSPAAIAFTPGGGRAYVAAESGNVYVLNTDPASAAYNTVVATVALAGSPSAVAATPDGMRVYVANSTSNNVSVIDTATNTLVDADTTDPDIDPISVGMAPKGTAIAPDGTRAYVADSQSGEVSVIDTDPTSLTYNTVTATIGVGSNPRAVDVTASGAYAYVANEGSNNVSVVNTATDSVIATVALEIQVNAPPLSATPVTAPKGIAIDDTRNRVWAPGGFVPGWVPAAIPKINSDSAHANFNKVDGNFFGAIGVRPFATAITPDGRHAYVTGSGGSSVTVLDTVTHAVEATVPVGIEPSWVAMTPDGGHAWVANAKFPSISIIDTATRTVVDTIDGVTGAIAFTPDGKQAYVVNYANGNLRVVDTSTKAVVKTLVIGLGANGVATSPDGKRAYTFNLAEPGELPGSIKVIDTTTNEIVDEISLAVLGPYFPTGVAVSPDGNRLYVTAGYGEPPDNVNIVAVIDTSTDAPVSSIPNVPSLERAAGFAITPDGRKAYLPNGNGVKAIDLETGTTAGTITIPGVGGAMSAAIVPNQGPEAAVSAAVESGAPSASRGARARAAGDAEIASVAGYEVHFDASASADSDGSIARYDWDFGDGTGAPNGGPTPRHTYAEAGTYRATVTVTDNEDCSTELVYAGQTAYCNGSGAATASITVTVNEVAGGGAPDACGFSLTRPYVSVSHWRAIDTRLRGRLKAYAGGYLLKDNKRSVFALQVRGIRGKSDRALDRVVFYLDGQRVANDRKAPYIASADPASLSYGTHELKATVFPRAGRPRTLTLGFFVSGCEDAAFSASMSSKAKRAHPNLELRARSGGVALQSVRFTLPRQLRLHAKGLTAGNIGLVRLRREFGVRSTRSLRLKKRSGNTLELAAGARMSVRLSLAGKRSFLELSGLKGEDVTAVDLRINGKQTRTVENPNSCAPKLRFRAALTSTEGKTAELKRSLQMCKKTPR